MKGSKKMKNTTNVDKYRRLAPIYDLFMKNRLFLNARSKAFALLNIKPDDRVLLVGIGTGIDISLLPQDCNIVGIDISEEMLKKARRKCRDCNVNLFNMNAESLQFDSNTFDYIVLNLILSVVENPKKALSEAVRVLSADGKVLIFDKFVTNQDQISVGRKIFNKITSFIGTDINRKFEDIAEGIPIRILLNESSIFGGNFKIIMLEKQC